VFLLPDWAVSQRTDIDEVLTTVGTYVERDGEYAIINFRDSSAPIRMATTYRPVPGEPVTLTCVKNQWRVTGPTRARSSTGTITKVAYPRVTVECDDKSYQLGYSTKLDDLHVGDKVAIVWSGGGYVSDKVTATNDDGNATPRLTTDQRPFELNLFAKQSGSFRKNKWWTQDVRADDGGGWFYGADLARKLRDDARITSVELYLPLRSAKGALPKIGRHTQGSRPSSALSLSDTFRAKARSGWIRLPVAWAETWRASAGGVGISGTDSGDNVYKGIQADRQSGKLRIKGRQ
jgi:hypothetical protein